MSVQRKINSKIHFWGEMFEDVIELKPIIWTIMKYISVCISTVTIIYSLSWLIFNVLHVIKDDTLTMEVKVTVYALLSLFNAIAILVLIWSKK